MGYGLGSTDGDCLPSSTRANKSPLRRGYTILHAIIREHVYYADFGGAYSIKAVGPVVAPKITYDDLDHVADGGAAAWAFERIAAGRCNGDENTLRQTLEEHCRRDTVAMVEIHSQLAKWIRALTVTLD
jgi:hypothetical protein